FVRRKGHIAATIDAGYTTGCKADLTPSADLLQQRSSTTNGQQTAKTKQIPSVPSTVTHHDLLPCVRHTGVISVISRVDIKQSVTYILDVKVVNRISSNSDSLSSHNSEIHRGADAEKLVAPFTKVAAIVDLIDINDNEPEPNKHVTHCFAYNNIESSIPLCTIPVGDADSGVNGQISFSIATEDGLSDTQEFKIDVNTGTIYKAKRNVKKLLEGDYSFVISIIDHGVPYLETAARIIVTIVAPANRTNNHAPIFIGNPEKLITISENAKVGTPISFIGATDADGDRVSMHIVSGNTEGNYAIEEGNLVIARDHLFSRNIVSNLTIMATDGIDSIYHNITVVVPKVVKAIPIRIFQHDTMLDRVSAVDEPIVANLTDDAVDVHYANFSIYSASSTYAMAAFTIDPCCGIVRLRKQLDYKMCKDCNLVIEITDTRFPRDYYRSFSKLNFQVLGSSTQPPSQVGPTMAPTKSDIKPISSTTSIASSDFETIPPTSIATPFPGIADTTTSYRITHASTSSLPSTFLDSNVLPVRSSTTPTPSLNKITTSSGNRSQAHVSKNVEKNTVTIDRPAHPTLSPSPPDIGRDSSSIEQLVTRPHVHRNHTHSTTAYWPTRPPPTAYHKSHPSIPDTEIATTPSPGLHRKRHSLFSFSGSSFIKYTTNTPEISKLTLQFRTCQSKFILMYSNSSHGSYILDAVGSNLRFRFAIPVLGSSGNFNGLIQLKSIMVNDGLWHELTLEKHGATYSLTVDKIFFSSTEAPIGKFAQSSFPNGIYHHYFGAETILVNEMGFIYDTVRENGLIGCMNDIRIGSVPLVVLEEVSLPGLGLTNIELGCNQNPTSMITCSPIMSFDVPPPPSAPGAKEPPIADSFDADISYSSYRSGTFGLLYFRDRLLIPWKIKEQTPKEQE
ncbi:Fat-like cadherin-related tumor suppressor-like protein, partial [Fragariocoptes setiger]